MLPTRICIQSIHFDISKWIIEYQSLIMFHIQLYISKMVFSLNNSLVYLQISLNNFNCPERQGKCCIELRSICRFARRYNCSDFRTDVNWINRLVRQHLSYYSQDMLRMTISYESIVSYFRSLFNPVPVSRRDGKIIQMWILWVQNSIRHRRW